MKALRPIFTSLALAGLLAAQPAAAAADARAATPVAEGEQLTGMGVEPGALMLLAVMAAVTVYILIDNSNEDDIEIPPVSP